MKKDKNISLSPSSVDERLGSVLSRGLAQLETGYCPEPESIAAVVEGTVAIEERDRLLKHVTACDTCYEMFLLTSQLQEEEESKKETHKILRLKPLALAASFLIVIFSLYIFYKSGEFQKVSMELREKSDAMEETKEKFRQPIPASPKARMSVVKDKEEEETAEKKPAAPLLKYGGKKIEAKAASKPAPEPKKEAPRDELVDKKERDSSAGVRARLEREKREDVKTLAPAKKGVDEERYNIGAVKSKTTGRKKSGKPDEIKTKMKMATQMAKEGEAVQSSYPREGQAVPLQSQAVLLNQVGQRFDDYIPQEDLGKLFKETIVLSQQLGKEFETIQTEAVKTGNLNEIDSYVKGLKPMITVKMVGDKANISPNVEWFFSKSAPRSTEYQFFSLARSGWCDNSGLCYEWVKGVRRKLKRDLRLKGKVSESEDATRRLLVKWNALHPQLSGIFKEVSANTITHLKVSK